MKKSKTLNLAMIAYLAVCLFWGSTYLAIRIGVQYMAPTILAGFRFLIAGSIMLGYAYFKKEKYFETKEDLKNSIIVGLLLLVGGNGLVVWAEQFVHSGIASVIVAAVPLFMAILATTLPSTESVTKKGWFGLILGFSGVVFLMSSSITSFDFHEMKGFLGLLAAAIFWSLGSIYSKNNKIKSSTIYNIGMQMFASGIMFIILSAINGELFKIVLSPQGIGSVLYLVIFGSLIGYSSYIYILDAWPVEKAGTYAYVNPVVAIFLGWLILSEPINLKILFSSAVILLGVYIVQTSKRKTLKVKQEEKVSK